MWKMNPKARVYLALGSSAFSDGLLAMSREDPEGTWKFVKDAWGTHQDHFSPRARQVIHSLEQRYGN